MCFLFVCCGIEGAVILKHREASAKRFAVNMCSMWVPWRRLHRHLGQWGKCVSQHAFTCNTSQHRTHVTNIGHICFSTQRNVQRISNDAFGVAKWIATPFATTQSTKCLTNVQRSILVANWCGNTCCHKDAWRNFNDTINEAKLAPATLYQPFCKSCRDTSQGIYNIFVHMKRAGTD